MFASFIQSFIHQLLGTYSILEAWLGVGNAEMDIVFPSDNSESGLRDRLTKKEIRTSR